MKNFDKKVAKMTDEECLDTVVSLLDRIDLDTRFIVNTDGLITHQVLVIGCGDRVVTSDPMAFDWPLQRLPVPEALEPHVA